MNDNSLRCVTWSIVEAEQAGLDELAYRRFIQLSDDLTNDAEVRELITAGVENTGTRWDDAVAALVEHHFINLGLPSTGMGGGAWSEPCRTVGTATVHAAAPVLRGLR